MRPSSGRSTSGAVCALPVVLLVLLVPLAMMKWLAGAVAPAMMESVSHQLRNYLTAASAPVLVVLKMALTGLALLASVLYLGFLLRPLGLLKLKRRTVPNFKGSKYYVKLGRKAAAAVTPLRRVPAK